MMKRFNDSPIKIFYLLLKYNGVTHVALIIQVNLDQQIITYRKFPLNEEFLQIINNVSMGWTRLVCTVLCSHKMYHGSGLPTHYLRSQFYCTSELNTFKWLNGLQLRPMLREIESVSLKCQLI
jgi:hypothetical protein